MCLRSKGMSIWTDYASAASPIVRKSSRRSTLLSNPYELHHAHFLSTPRSRLRSPKCQPRALMAIFILKFATISALPSSEAAPRGL